VSNPLEDMFLHSYACPRCKAEERERVRKAHGLEPHQTEAIDLAVEEDRKRSAKDAVESMVRSLSDKIDDEILKEFLEERA
jgi:hypothetical protein